MASEHVLVLTNENWQTEVEQSEVPVLVDFWAPWCGPCRALGPTIDKIADKFAGKVKVGKLNVDDSPDIATNFGINTIPRVLIFNKSKQPKSQFVGVTPETELVKAINSALEG